ncbi:aldehyde dehydrogenase family protein [Paenactinomyces guangxiensis]|uniref:Aldehyde dehydrogenase family protein n=1 Tax=Paenactinomyces guangxiensis TaxID=1490290 RepID=A0A7W2A8D4_9BACL|nr:aldehyde dehydrogenase family protein [Paenactinomyces guangxiensis]MBA4494042.1 aldehyde dehydrogenase family protein [Paenactinomyces guangxiensis]MBH8591213.1 aldehyde dehydrogenase family protein [Paenactinomyces guangxiensis]
MKPLTKGLFINGEWIKKEAVYPLYSPYSGELLAHISRADPDDAEQAIAGADRAFAKMKALPAYERSRILARVARIIQDRKEELAKVLAREAGKPIRTARAELERTLVTYQFSAEEAKRIGGETIPMDAAPGGEGRLGMTWREPLGVVVAITPFNFPFNLVAHKLGPAFAAGNTVVLKPAEQTPLSALLIAEIFTEAGLPKGALQVVTGYGTELSDALLTDVRVKKISFTGSVQVGKLIKAKAGLKKVTLELGSNSGLIVEPDAPVDKIIPRCVEGAFAFAGQVCISLQRIYVHESIYREFTELFIRQTKKLNIGDPLDETTDLSSMIHPGETDRIEAWVNEAVQAGATIGCGGSRKGKLYPPTVLLNVTKEMKVSCHEVFAPVVSIVSYKELDEAIEMINDSVYGLNAGIYTSNIDNALYAARNIQAGGVMINDIPTFRVDHMPYGGVKESGYGREGIKYAVQEMTELKLITIKNMS